ncbi:MAG: aspartate aminotransferase family protein [Cryomorphaceae bacterium]|nr:MAG: aspartate aminotransferase family protein [Cryomorphaceae bacterium]
MSTNRERFFALQAQTTDHPMGLEIAHAEGIWVTDTNGIRYMDLVSGLAVTNIGHRHPAVIEAIKSQCDWYLHAMPYGEYIQAPQVELAERMCTLAPAPLKNIYYVNSGTEANEAALKLAKRYTGRTQLIGFQGAYHGSTHGSLSLSGNEKKKTAFRPLLPDTDHLRINVFEDLERITHRTAGVILETIQADAGVRIPAVGFMQALRARCDETGALLILDEIQSGMGRTGKLFAFEHYGIIPDVVTLAKAFGAGMPMGAFMAAPEVMASLRSKPMLGHITTFGGHPVCCAAALAGLNALIDERMMENCEAKGALFESLLNHPAVQEIRRKGLMLAVEFESFEQVHAIYHACLERGVITFWFLSCNNSFRLAPPLNITEEEIRDACARMSEAMNSVLG